MRSDSSAFGGHHDDRNGGRRRVGADGLAQLQPVEAGQHQVEHDQLGHFLLDLRHHVAARQHDHGKETRFFQVMLEQGADVRIVLGDEDPCGWAHSHRIRRS